jgi:hypothetical protein
MTEKWQLPSSDPSQLAHRVDELKKSLGSLNPLYLADRIGATYEASESGGRFQLAYWGRTVALTYPEFDCNDSESGKTLSLMDQAMLAYYLSTSDGTPLTGRWISFSELPDGTFYSQAFQGYTGGELAKIFADDIQAFLSAAASITGAMPVSGDTPGDRALACQVLPNVRMLAACWLGDEDFPSSYRILFDAAAGRHLTTDAYAILGSMLTRRIIGARRSQGLGVGG